MIVRTSGDASNPLMLRFGNNRCRKQKEPTPVIWAVRSKKSLNENDLLTSAPVIYTPRKYALRVKLPSGASMKKSFEAGA